MRSEFSRIFLPDHFSAESDNRVIQELLDGGTISVYVQVQNNSNSLVKFKLEQISIEAKAKKFTVIFPEDIPTQLERLNGKAIGANIVNTVFVVGVVVGVIVAAIAIGSINPVGNIGSFIDGGSSSKSMYNPVIKSINLEYQDLSLNDSTIKAGEVFKGLMFFNVPNNIDRDDLILSFS